MLQPLTLCLATTCNRIVLTCNHIVSYDVFVIFLPVALLVIVQHIDIDTMKYLRISNYMKTQHVINVYYGLFLWVSPVFGFSSTWLALAVNNIKTGEVLL